MILCSFGGYFRVTKVLGLRRSHHVGGKNYTNNRAFFHCSSCLQHFLNLFSPKRNLSYPKLINLLKKWKCLPLEIFLRLVEMFSFNPWHLIYIPMLHKYYFIAGVIPSVVFHYFVLKFFRIFFPHYFFSILVAGVLVSSPWCLQSSLSTSGSLSGPTPLASWMMLTVVVVVLTKQDNE